jgi:hypothetical protein
MSLEKKMYNLVNDLWHKECKNLITRDNMILDGYTPDRFWNEEISNLEAASRLLDKIILHKKNKDDVAITDITLLRGENVKYLHDKALTLCTIRWETLLGDTIKEKMEGIYTKLVECSNIAKAKSDDMPTAIIASPKFASIFQTGCYWQDTQYFPSEPYHRPHAVNPLGSTGRWQIFTSPHLKDNELLLTCLECPNPSNTVRFTCESLLADQYGDWEDEL